MTPNPQSLCDSGTPPRPGVPPGVPHLSQRPDGGDGQGGGQRPRGGLVGGGHGAVGGGHQHLALQQVHDGGDVRAQPGFQPGTPCGSAVRTRGERDPPSPPLRRPPRTPSTRPCTHRSGDGEDSGWGEGTPIPLPSQGSADPQNPRHPQPHPSPSPPGPTAPPLSHPSLRWDGGLSLGWGISPSSSSRSGFPRPLWQWGGSLEVPLP